MANLESQKFNQTSQDYLKLGSKEFKKIFGTTNVPNLLIDHQAELGVDIVELGLLLHLLRHDYHNEFLVWPGIGTLKKRTGLKKQRIRQILKQLQNKKYLNITPQYKESTKTWSSNLYDFSPLFERLQKLAQELMKFSELMKSSNLNLNVEERQSELENESSGSQNAPTTPKGNTLPLGTKSDLPLGTKSDLPLGTKSDLPLGTKSDLPRYENDPTLGTKLDPEENETKKKNEERKNEKDENEKHIQSVSVSSSSFNQNSSLFVSFKSRFRYEDLANKIAYDLNCPSELRSIYGFISKYPLTTIEKAYEEALLQFAEKEIRNPVAYLYGIIKKVHNREIEEEIEEKIKIENDKNQPFIQQKNEAVEEIEKLRKMEIAIEEYKKTLSQERLKEIEEQAEKEVRELLKINTPTTYEMLVDSPIFKPMVKSRINEILLSEMARKVAGLSKNEDK